ncbi:hypothetical protein [Planotetraspora sp. GP83]|uniref:hypothetical protein n=1 Tax=Planotetraspora sp. GP83 TaxID=3156264 RepID=UPI003511D3C9
MSFELGVWWEAFPITEEEASLKYAAWCRGERSRGDRRRGDGATAEPRFEVAAFYEELTSDFPDLTADNYGSSPWSTPLTVGADFVLMSMVFPRAGEVCRVVQELAVRHGLVCFDPHGESVRAPTGITMADGSLIVGPDAEAISRRLGASEPPL